MPQVQTTFIEGVPGGYPGMEADGELSNIISVVLEGTTPAAFGRAVFKGTADRGGTLTPNATLRGFAIARKGLPLTAARAADTFAPGDTMPVKNRGKIWVQSATAAAKDDPVFVTPAGLVSNSATGNTAATGWVFDDTITAAGIVRIVRR